MDYYHFSHLQTISFQTPVTSDIHVIFPLHSLPGSIHRTTGTPYQLPESRIYSGYHNNRTIVFGKKQGGMNSTV